WTDPLPTFTLAVLHHKVDLDLVSFGVGKIVLPAEIAGRVKDLGFLPQAEVGDAYAAAAAYVQPSLYESFSRTIMESWLAGTPVIANTACEVVRWLCERSGGGLLADGREVEVVSPKPSAAHHHADVGNPKGAAKLTRLVGGAELVARFDPGILGQSGGAGPAAARAAVGLAVRRARSATIHLSPL